MINIQHLKLFIIFTFFLFIHQDVFAQDIPQVSVKTSENINTVPENNPQTDNTADINTDNNNQSNPDNNLKIFEIFNLGNIKPDNPDIKPKVILKKSNQNKNSLNLKNLELKPANNTEINRIRSYVSRFLKKYHLTSTTFVAILGLLGTFLGLFSSWTIYLLNKKNNDPLIIDKKDSAIKYLEAIERIKEHLYIEKFKQLNILLDNILAGSLSPAESEKLTNLISLYSKCTIAISKVPLIEIHSRYKKHIKKNRIDIFNSFISLYKMIEVDGKFYSNTEGIFDNDNLQSMNFFAEDNARKWKHKIITLLSIEEKANIIKKLITKDLRK